MTELYVVTSGAEATKTAKSHCQRSKSDRNQNSFLGEAESGQQPKRVLDRRTLSDLLRCLQTMQLLQFPAL